MILFAGIPTEAPVALAVRSAERQQIPHLVLNQRRWTFCDLHVGASEGIARGEIWLDEKLWPLDAFTGIYSRIVEPDTLPESRPRGAVMPDPRQLARSTFVYNLLNDWLEIAPGFIVNRPNAMASNVSKPFQAQLIMTCGFATPPTLVTNDPEQVRDFHARHGRIVYKSVSSVRSIVMEWRDGQGDLEKVKLLPTQFQAFIQGTNIRVHVVGDVVFATAIESQSVDYRYAGRDGDVAALQATTLPPDIEDKCRRLTKRLGLAFSGIDLKKTPDGEWFCFEVNTSPGYSYFQEQSGQPIADALVAFLAGPDRESMSCSRGR
jgi:RimK-like ATP-grasp domain